MTFAAVVCFAIALFFNDFGVYTVFKKVGLVKNQIDDKLVELIQKRLSK